jgi:hypothetical protein
MNLFKIIESLYDQKARIERAISTLEALEDSARPAPVSQATLAQGKRGRGRPRKHRPAQARS